MTAHARPALADDTGSSIVEFLAVTVLLLVPVLYLVLVLGRLQGAVFAAEGAAHEAGRSYAQAPTSEQGARDAVASVALALRDQGFDQVDPTAALAVTCSTPTCLAPGSEVEAVVAFDVALPFIPSFVRDVVPLSIPVSAVAVAPVDQFRGRP